MGETGAHRRARARVPRQARCCSVKHGAAPLPLLLPLHAPVASALPLLLPLHAPVAAAAGAGRTTPREREGDRLIGDVWRRASARALPTTAHESPRTTVDRHGQRWRPAGRSQGKTPAGYLMQPSTMQEVPSTMQKVPSTMQKVPPRLPGTFQSSTPRTLRPSGFLRLSSTRTCIPSCKWYRCNGPLLDSQSTTWMALPPTRLQTVGIRRCGSRAA
jgi:hypothetical protein